MWCYTDSFWKLIRTKLKVKFGCEQWTIVCTWRLVNNFFKQSNLKLCIFSSVLCFFSAVNRDGLKQIRWYSFASCVWTKFMFKWSGLSCNPYNLNREKDILEKTIWRATACCWIYWIRNIRTQIHRSGVYPVFSSRTNVLSRNVGPNASLCEFKVHFSTIFTSLFFSCGRPLRVCVSMCLPA